MLEIDSQTADTCTYLVHDAAHQALSTFSATPTLLRDALMRMALEGDTLPARALFCAILALSSLRRNGLHRQALAFKVSAIEALSSSIKDGALNSSEIAQHVATCMLLCTFEVGLKWYQVMS